MIKMKLLKSALLSLLGLTFTALNVPSTLAQEEIQSLVATNDSGSSIVPEPQAWILLLTGVFLARIIIGKRDS